MRIATESSQDYEETNPRVDPILTDYMEEQVPISQISSPRLLTPNSKTTFLIKSIPKQIQVSDHKLSSILNNTTPIPLTDLGIFDSKMSNLNSKEISKSSYNGEASEWLNQTHQPPQMAINCHRFQKIRRYILDQLCRLPPSIPSGNHFGYFETKEGQLRPLRPPIIYHSGEGKDQVGPGHYTPKPPHPKGTVFHLSQAKREVFESPQYKVGPGWYVPNRGQTLSSKAFKAYNSLQPNSSFASKTTRFHPQKQGPPGPGTYLLEDPLDLVHQVISPRGNSRGTFGGGISFEEAPPVNTGQMKDWQKIMQYIQTEGCQQPEKRFKLANYQFSNLGPGSYSYESQTATPRNRGNPAQAPFMSSAERFFYNIRKGKGANLGGPTSISNQRGHIGALEKKGIKSEGYQKPGAGGSPSIPHKYMTHVGAVNVIHNSIVDNKAKVISKAFIHKGSVKNLGLQGPQTCFGIPVVRRERGKSLGVALKRQVGGHGALQGATFKKTNVGQRLLSSKKINKALGICIELRSGKMMNTSRSNKEMSNFNC